VIAEHVPVRRTSSAMPALAPPQEPKMDTMRIATPLGYSSRPPRRVWPLVLGLATLLGVGGGVVSVTCFGHDNAARSEAAEVREGGGRGGEGGEAQAAATAPAAGSSGPGSAAGTGAPASAAGQATAEPATAGQAGGRPANPVVAAAPGSQVADRPAGAGSPPGVVGSTGTAGGAASGAPGTPAGAGTSPGGTGGASAVRPVTPAATRTAHLTIESVPTGAVVKGSDGAALGRTPLALDWPISDAPVRFELRLAGYKSKLKQTVINGNTRLVIELEHVVVRRRGTGAGPARPGSGNGLMRPGD